MDRKNDKSHDVSRDLDEDIGSTSNAPEYSLEAANRARINAETANTLAITEARDALISFAEKLAMRYLCFAGGLLLFILAYSIIHPTVKHYFLSSDSDSTLTALGYLQGIAVPEVAIALIISMTAVMATLFLGLGRMLAPKDESGVVKVLGDAAAQVSNNTPAS